MASYIKTDTNVFEVVSETDEYWVVKGKRSGTTYKKYKNATTLLKRADSIIGVLDEIVIEHEDGDKDIYKSTMDGFYWHCRGDSYCDFRIDEVGSYDGEMLGYVWVKDEHGKPMLKPVAMRNKENGEWELL